MTFIPDSLEKKIKLTVKIDKMRLVPFKEKGLPKIKDGTIVDLILPAFSLENDKEKLIFADLKEKKVLDKGTEVKCKLYSNGPIELGGCIVEDLYFCYKNDDSLVRSRLCKCEFKNKLGEKFQFGSLNEAYSKLSEIYEKERKSHTGNIFLKILYKEKTNFYPLDKLRKSV